MPLGTGPSPLSAAADDVLRGIRDLRFATGGACPRCGHHRPIRWGSFAGRQRYRCRACRRTFSDLTGTALAYTKRLECWQEYLLRFRDAPTLRAVAGALGIHVSTAFRWRHRILQSTRRGERHVCLAGWVEMSEIVFAVSRKGTRLPPGFARCRGARFTPEWPLTPHARVLLARDRRGIAADYQLAGAVSASADIAAHFAGIAKGSTILLGGRSPALYAIAARVCGHAFAAVPDAWIARDRWRHVRNITAFRARFLRWLPRFRGVATHYLANYCAWHRMVDRDSPAGWLHSCFGHVAATAPRPP